MFCGAGWKTSAFWAWVSQDDRLGEVEVDYDGGVLKVLTFTQNVGCKQDSEFVFWGGTCWRFWLLSGLGQFVTPSWSP